ncbi:MAG: hypothetical protein ACK4TP_10085 [Hyphomicrobium sp.]
MNMDLMKVDGAERHVDTSKIDRMDVRERIAKHEDERAAIPGGPASAPGNDGASGEEE